MGKETIDVLRETRRHGWYPTYKSATQRIREHFESKPNGLRGSTALAVYGAILEALNDDRGDGRVEIARRELAALACVQLKAASEYQAELERAGVIAVERRQVEGVNLPNIVYVLDTDERGPADPTPVPSTPGVGSPAPQGSGPQAPQLPEEGPTALEEREEARATSKPVSYRGRRVPDVVVEGAERALETFREAAGRGPAARTGTGDPSPALKQAIGAMLARPDVPVEDWERGIRAFCSAPPDWAADGGLQVGHVFGERAAEWVLAAGRRGEVPAQRVSGGQMRHGSVVAHGDRVLAEMLGGAA